MYRWMEAQNVETLMGHHYPVLPVVVHGLVPDLVPGLQWRSTQLKHHSGFLASFVLACGMYGCLLGAKVVCLCVVVCISPIAQSCLVVQLNKNKKKDLHSSKTVEHLIISLLPQKLNSANCSTSVQEESMFVWTKVRAIVHKWKKFWNKGEISRDWLA